MLIKMFNLFFEPLLLIGCGVLPSVLAYKSRSEVNSNEQGG